MTSRSRSRSPVDPVVVISSDDEGDDNKDGDLDDNLVVLEVFSRCRVSPYIVKAGYRAFNLDQKDGQDVFSIDGRRHFWSGLHHKPKVMILSPPCTMFSTLQQTNKTKMNPRVWQNQMRLTEFMWDMAIRMARAQHKGGCAFIIEHPASALSWNRSTTKAFLNQFPRIQEVVFDMCAIGMRAPGTLEPIRKRTKLLTNSDLVVRAFQTLQCTCQVPHMRISGRYQGQNLSTYAAHYPEPMCELLANLSLQIAGIQSE